jgi:hypothetical protein
MTNQTSISEKVTVEGVNVYNGRRNTATFYPAEENSGLVFLMKGVKVPAKLEFAENRRKAIGLDNGEARIHLVEHMLSAVYALGIDNLQIELSDGVCPTTDNCAYEYFEALRQIRAAQTAPRRFWRYSKDHETHMRNAIIVIRYNEAPIPSPTEMHRKRYPSSSGSLIAVRNLIIDKAPTSPKDNVNEDFTTDIISVVVIAIGTNTLANFVLSGVPTTLSK